MSNELKAEEVIAELEKAHRYVVELSKGERKWDMHIPAMPDEDPDLVIGKALRDAMEALASRPVRDGVGEENDRLRKALVRADNLRTAVEKFLEENEPLLPSEHKLRRALRAFDNSLLPPTNTERKS